LRSAEPSGTLAAVNDDPRGRTYSSWWFLVVFAVLAGLGLAGLLLLGTPSSPTEILPTAQTFPDGWDAAEDGDGDGVPTSTSAAPDAASDGSAPSPPDPPTGGAPTFADGTPAPDGVTEVLLDDDATVLAFALPEGTDPGAFAPRVAPVSAAILEDGRVLGVRVGCAASADELLAQLAIVEAGDGVTLTAVSLVPPDGAPCVPGTEAAFVEVPLRAPLQGRSVRVTPPGDPEAG